MGPALKFSPPLRGQVISNGLTVPPATTPDLPIWNGSDDGEQPVPVMPIDGSRDAAGTVDVPPNVRP